MFRFSILVALPFEVFRFSFAQNSVLICFLVSSCKFVCVILLVFIGVNGGVYEHVLVKLACVFDLSATVNTFWNATKKRRYECVMYSMIWFPIGSANANGQWPHLLFHPISIGQTHACDHPVNTSYPFSI